MGEKLEKEHNLQSSSNYNMLTEYTKNIFEATLDPSVDLLAFTGAHFDSTASITTLRSLDDVQRSSPMERRTNMVCFTFEGQHHAHVYTWLSQERYALLTKETRK